MLHAWLGTVWNKLTEREILFFIIEKNIGNIYVSCMYMFFWGIIWKLEVDYSEHF